MTTATSVSKTTPSACPLPPMACNQCGTTDKKLDTCGRCHIEKYCSRTCQAAAWPKHKLVCLVDSKKKADPSTKTIEAVARWTGKRFGELRGHRIIDKDVRILSHTGGFAIFLPEELWRKLDYQVPLTFPENESSECWIAGRGFAFIKCDVNPSEVEGSGRDFISDNLETALAKIETFARKNFFDNRQAYPDSSYFTHGSFKDSPDMPRPFRLRLGGNFRYQF